VCECVTDCYQKQQEPSTRTVRTWKRREYKIDALANYVIQIVNEVRYFVVFISVYRYNMTLKLTTASSHTRELISQMQNSCLMTFLL